MKSSYFKGRLLEQIKKSGAPKDPKYLNERESLDGRSFHSKGEAACYQMLKLMERAGELKILQCQDHVTLTLPPTTKKIKCIPDFKIETCSGVIEWVEFKGFETPEWLLKKKIWAAFGPGRLTIYGGDWKRIRLIEVIDPEYPQIDG